MFNIRNSFHRAICKVEIKNNCDIVHFKKLYSSPSFQLKSKFGHLADQINEAALQAGLGPIAEVEDSSENSFDINQAKSIQDIKSMKELKDIQEITAMKEIKSIQEIPDDIADKFISVIINYWLLS